MRANRNEQLFANWLRQIGNGDQDPTLDIQHNGDDTKAFVKIPAQCVTNNVLQTIFPTQDRFHLFSNRVILSPWNEDLETVNMLVLHQIPGDIQQYFSIDTATDWEGEELINEQYYSPEVLHKSTLPRLPPHELKLKLNTTAILLRNLNVAKGLRNGTWVRIRGTFLNVLVCEIMSGKQKGTIAFIQRVDCVPSTKGNLPFIFIKRHQFPLQLSYGISINKSQG